MSISSIPNQLFHYKCGGTSAMTDAHMCMQLANNRQNMLANLHGGKNKFFNGGTSYATIPQFNTPGGSVSPFNSNTQAVNSNTNLMSTINNGCGDCYVTNSCSTMGCNMTAGSKYRKRKTVTKRTRKTSKKRGRKTGKKRIRKTFKKNN